jgi:hypothetical protein
VSNVKKFKLNLKSRFLKKNEILFFAGKWVKLENFMLNKLSPAQKIKGCIFSLICGS